MGAHKLAVMPDIRFTFSRLFISLGIVSSAIGAAAQEGTSFCRKDSLPVYSNNREVLRDAGSWLTPGLAATGYASFTYLCYRHFDDDIQRFAQRNHSNVLSAMAGGLTYVGLGRFQSITLAGTAVTAFALHNDKLKQTVIIWAASLVVNSIATDELKKTFQRHRPNTGDPSNVFDWRGGPGINKSFPSAHTSNAFATATVFATMYKNTKWVPPVAYLLAGAVGFSRIYKNEHWASDVLAGAAVGFLSAKSMNALYKVAGHKFSFLPEVGYRDYAVCMVYRF